jgi:hypothetical protein
MSGAVLTKTFADETFARCVHASFALPIANTPGQIVQRALPFFVSRVSSISERDTSRSEAAFTFIATHVASLPISGPLAGETSTSFLVSMDETHRSPGKLTIPCCYDARRFAEQKSTNLYSASQPGFYA